MSYPLSIVLAGDGNFYVSEGKSGEIHRVDRDGTVTLFARVPGSGNPINSDGVGEAASFDNPLGATVSNDGSKLYVISGTHLVFDELIETSGGIFGAPIAH